MARLLEKAKDTLHNGGFSIVVLNQNNEYVSSESGISALLLLLKDKPDMLRGASIADKVVGKAAAMLMVYGCVAEVYAGIVSRHAMSVFERAGLTLHYDRLVPHIINRAGTGICPMEKKVLLMDDPAECFKALSDT